MAHFAQINSDGVVVQVVVVPDSQEHRGQDYLAVDCGLGGTWIKTSYNGNIRKRFATKGGKYDSDLDIFIRPQPYPSWTLNTDYEWEPPTPMPDDGQMYMWEESTQSWVIAGGE